MQWDRISKAKDWFLKKTGPKKLLETKQIKKKRW